MICMPVMAEGYEGFNVAYDPTDTKTYVTSLNVEGIATEKIDYIQNTAVSVPIIAYEKPRITQFANRPNNDGMIYNAVLVTAYPGRYPYSGVTTA